MMSYIITYSLNRNAEKQKHKLIYPVLCPLSCLILLLGEKIVFLCMLILIVLCTLDTAIVIQNSSVLLTPLNTLMVMHSKIETHHK